MSTRKHINQTAGRSKRVLCSCHSWLRGLVGLFILVLIMPGLARASVLFDMVAVDNSAALSGYITYDLQVTTDTDWTAAAMLLDLSAGSFYQHAYGGNTGPANPALIALFPELAFDTYVAGSIAGGAGDLGGSALSFDTDRLDVSWFNINTTDTGTTTIGRVTFTDDAAGDLTIMLTAGGTGATQYTLPITGGTAQSAMMSGGESSLTSGADSEVGLSFITPRPRLYGSDYVDTRPFTPCESCYFTDKPKTIDWPRPRPTMEPITSVSSESTTPEPGSLALIGTCMGLVTLKRR